MENPLLEVLQDRIFSVNEYVEFVNALITPLDVSVVGEVIDFKETRDWIFFSLKDTEHNAILSCGLHSSGYKHMGVRLEDGMEIKVHGHSKVTPKSGRFGFWVDHIELVGEGAIRRAYELLFAQLKKEGLFERKRPLPECIEHIGVISSRDGVVIHDLLKNLKGRGMRIDFLHSAVDGEKSAGELIKAVEYFSYMKEKPDVVVIIRGGGSLESLQGFNNEALCRAIFACPVPVIAGIGHDVDVPLAAMVADASTSTPTAVAHLINQTWDDALLQIPEYQRAIERYVEERIENAQALLADVSKNIEQHFGAMLKEVAWKVKNFEQLLALADPTRVLKRGYSIAYAPDGTVVRSVHALKKGDSITTTVSDGVFTARVESVQETKNK